MGGMNAMCFSHLRWVVCSTLMTLLTSYAGLALSQTASVTSCDTAGIGAAKLSADAPATITSVSTASAGTGATAVPYCLVKVRVAQAVNIWVGLPMQGKWNGRLESEGGGGYVGLVAEPTKSVQAGYVGVQTDTGHPDPSDPELRGDFGMLSPGVPNVDLQKDFAYRSEHLMAVIGKQLAQSFYGQAPAHSYWNGCSTGGRQGLRMAQDFPADYDGILAGAPAIHWDRFQAYQIWPQMVMKELAGGPISSEKKKLATSAAIAACDAANPHVCKYSAAADKNITRAACNSSDNSCLTTGEATAIDRIWNGATDSKGKLLWPGLERGASLDGLAGPKPFGIAVNSPRYWVYFDPNWDWHTLTFANYDQFFQKSVQVVGPLMASDSPNLSAFRARGGKMITWHGLADPLIMPQGTVLYYDSVKKFFGKDYGDVQQFYRLFMAPGVGHCGGGDAPQPVDVFQSVVNWVERGEAPTQILASQTLPGGSTRTRPLCPYPSRAQFSGHGSTDDAANYACVAK